MSTQGTASEYALSKELKAIQETILVSAQAGNKEQAEAILAVQIDKIYKADVMINGKLTNPVLNALQNAKIKGAKQCIYASPLVRYQFSLSARRKRSAYLNAITTLKDIAPEELQVVEKEGSTPEIVNIRLNLIKATKAGDLKECEILFELFLTDINTATFDYMLNKLSLSSELQEKIRASYDVTLQLNAEKRALWKEGEKMLCDAILVSPEIDPEIILPETLKIAENFSKELLSPEQNKIQTRLLELVKTKDWKQIEAMIDMYADKIYQADGLSNGHICNPILASIAIEILKNDGDLANIDHAINRNSLDRYSASLNAQKKRTQINAVERLGFIQQISSKNIQLYRIAPDPGPKLIPPAGPDPSLVLELISIQAGIHAALKANNKALATNILHSHIDKIFQADKTINGTITNSVLKAIQKDGLETDFLNSASAFHRYKLSIEAQYKRNIYLASISQPEKIIPTEREIVGKEATPEIINVRLNFIKMARDGNLKNCNLMLEQFEKKIDAATLNYLLNIVPPLSDKVKERIEDELLTVDDSNPRTDLFTHNLRTAILFNPEKGPALSLPPSLEKAAQYSEDPISPELRQIEASLLKLAQADDWQQIEKIINMHADKIYAEDILSEDGQLTNPVLTRVALALLKVDGLTKQIDKAMNLTPAERHKASLDAPQLRAGLANKQDSAYQVAPGVGPEVFAPSPLPPKEFLPITPEEKTFIEAVKENNTAKVIELLQNLLIQSNTDLYSYALKNYARYPKIRQLLQKSQKAAEESWQDWQKQVINAIYTKNAEQLENLLNLKDNPLRVKYITRENNAILVEAVKANNLAAVERLLKFGRVKAAEIDVRYKDSSRFRARKQAVGNKAMLDLLEQSTHDLVDDLAPEQAMADLDKGQNLAIRALRKKYGPLSTAQVNERLQEMMNYFRVEYNKHPIIVKTKDGFVELPFDYDPRNPQHDQYKQFEKTYYHYSEYDPMLSHNARARRIHSAKRYFDIPNLLMDPTAENVGGEGNERFALNSDVHKEQMALIYLAAKSPPLHPDWVKGGKQKFIDELYEKDEDVLEALENIFDDLNRSHNTDEGLDPEKGQGEDGPDRPTCGGGVTKRIAQALHSILGIPSFTETQLRNLFVSELVVDKIESINEIDTLDRLYNILYNDMVVCALGWDELEENDRNFLEDNLLVKDQDLAKFLEKYRQIYLDPDNPNAPSLMDIPEQIHCKTFVEKGNNNRSGTELVQHMANPEVYFKNFCELFYTAIDKKRKALQSPRLKQRIKVGLEQRLKEQELTPAEPVSPSYIQRQREAKERYGREDKEKAANKHTEPTEPAPTGSNPSQKT